MSMQRIRMIERLRDHYKVHDTRVLDAMSRLPRHYFVPPAIQSQAYNDNALPISSGQTISQPFIVARMSELLGLTGKEKVLEIGAGSGYQTAVLAALARKVFAIERLPHLADEAKFRLGQLGIRNVTLKAADGTNGWDAYKPFDGILVAAGGPEIPDPLVHQLAVGGRLVVPVGKDRRSQNLIRITRTDTGWTQEDFGPVAFVPLIGEHGWEQS
ncbi:MAG: protein-L-isoaspartate(D-aspartate) O-methyltransferase [Acidobacteria bacterium]|nr:protein-L-isoaspartate(D-aspartate) O-methyltransferase [Acidobacteriota bacterium]